MCVIAVKEKGVKAIPEAEMKSMFEYNSDGAGFSYVLDNQVITEKGLMTYKDFERAYALFEKRLKTAKVDIKDIPLMLHFRIGTHGPNSEGLTHPFPISAKYEHLTALDYSSDIVMAHNGIINTVTPRGDWSDTQQYIKEIILPMAKSNHLFHRDPYMREIMGNTNSGSRFAFLDKDGEFQYVGDWKTKDGIKYSNLNHDAPSYSYARGYKPYTVATTRYKSKLLPLKAGDTIYPGKSINYDFSVKEGATGFTLSEKNEGTYFVDEYGAVFTKYGDMKPTLSNYYELAIGENGDVRACSFADDCDEHDVIAYDYTYTGGYEYDYYGA